MTPFENAVDFVLSHEGGLSEDPADPGGLTRWGISSRAYPDLDIRNLSREDAVAIYKRDYWDRCSCGKLPPALAFIVFDSSVNQGPVAAVRMLQQSLGVAADGVIGPVTIGAAADNVQNVACELVARRMFAYGSLPQFTRYGLGWSRRLAACHQIALEQE